MNVPEDALTAIRESVGDQPELQGSIAGLTELATLLWLAANLLEHAVRVAGNTVEANEPMIRELGIALALVAGHQAATATTADALQIIQHEREVGRRS